MKRIPGISKAIVSSLSFVVIVFIALWIAGCGGLVKKNPQYVTIITPWQSPDSAMVAYMKDSSVHPQRIYEADKRDSAFIRKNLTDYIIPFAKRLAVVKEIHDVSNTDSSVIVVELCDTCNGIDSRWIIEDAFKVFRKEMPEYMENMKIISGKPKN